MSTNQFLQSRLIQFSKDAMKKPAYSVMSLGLGFLTFFNSALAAPILYGLTFLNHQLIEIDGATAVSGLNGAVAGTLGSELARFGTDLYEFDLSNDEFRRIDPTNAATLGATTTAGINITGEGGMTFATSGNAFLSGAVAGGSGILYSCNVTINNSCTIVMTLGIAMDGLAFDSAGVLYGLSQSSTGTPASLYEIDYVARVEKFIGSTGLVGVNVAGLTFDKCTGNLYGGIGASLYTIHKMTGAATPVGNTGFGNYAGLADSPGACRDLPEPATLPLVALILIITGAGLLNRRR